MRIILAAIFSLFMVSCASAKDIEIAVDETNFYDGIIKDHADLTFCMGMMMHAYQYAIVNNDKVLANRAFSDMQKYKEAANDLYDVLIQDGELVGEVQITLFSVGTWTILMSGMNVRKEKNAEEVADAGLHRCWQIVGIETTP